MIIASFADIHARGADLDALNRQLGAALPVLEKRKPDLILIAGDVFDNSRIGDQHASTGAIAKVVCDWFANLGQIAPVYAIPGNHDMSGAGSADALHVLDNIYGVTVVREPWIDNLIAGALVAFIPWQWIGDPESEIERLMRKAQTDHMPMEWKIVLCAHIQVIGSIMQGARTCEAKPSGWQVSRRFLESLPVDRFIFGDFHARQEVVAGRGGYVGAIRQCNYGEEGNPAGFEVWDSETGAVEWVELDAAPKHCTLTEYSTRAQEQQIDLADFVYGVAEAYKTRVRFQDMEPDPDLVRDMESRGIVVEQIIERQERMTRADVPAGVLQDRHGLMRLWASNQQPTIEQDRLARMLAAHDQLFADKAVTA